MDPFGNNISYTRYTTTSETTTVNRVWCYDWNPCEGEFTGPTPCKEVALKNLWQMVTLLSPSIMLHSQMSFTSNQEEDIRSKYDTWYNFFWTNTLRKSLDLISYNPLELIDCLTIPKQSIILGVNFLHVIVI